MRSRSAWAWATGLWLALAAGLAVRAQGPTAEVMNEAPAWMVRVSVDRADRTYVVGEDVNVRVVSEQGGYLYLFDVDSGNAVTLLFPNRFRPDNRVQAGSTVAIPGPDGFHIRVGPRGLGTETLLAVVTKQPLQEVKPEEFSRDGLTPLCTEPSRRLLAEATLGRPDAARGLRDARDDLRRRDPDAYARRAGQFAEHSIRIRTAPARGSMPAKRVGLFVGVSRYANLPEKAQLHFAHLDALRMARACQQGGGLTRAVVLTDSAATLARVRAAFTELVASTGPGDTVLIFWSSHGGRVETGNPARPYVYRLLPHDANPNYFHEDEFGRWVQALDGRKVMVILDACYSGGQIEGAKTTSGGPTPDPAPRGLGPAHFLDQVLIRARSIGQHDAAILTACRLDQTSIESKELQAGLLTYYLARTLEETSGPLTLEAASRRVDPRVRAFMRGIGKAGQQTIVFSDQTPRPPALLRP
jgi:hypothetical protein